MRRGGASRVAGLVLALGLAAACPLPALAHGPYAPADDSALGPDTSMPSADDYAAPQIPQGRHPTGAAARLAAGVAASGDNGDMAFMIVDKLGAIVYAFDVDGSFLGSAPVLVGLARGDDSAPGIGSLKLSAISPDQRTTPAGRFVAQFGDSDGHGTVLWVDYADAISLHPVMSVNAGEHRQRRIKSAAAADHRISYGCINVPATFYEHVVLASFGADGGVVYVLPDTKPMAEVFPRFAAASGGYALAEQRPRHAQCIDQTYESMDRIPDPRPSRICPVEDRMSMQAASPDGF
jgi:hypothetical protein